MAKAVIFDMDGTLIDSVDLHAKAWQDAFLNFGHVFELKAIRDQIGKGGLDSGAKRNAVKRSGFERPFQARQSRLGMAS